jgi:hypothetical protein
MKSLRSLSKSVNFLIGASVLATGTIADDDAVCDTQMVWPQPERSIHCNYCAYMIRGFLKDVFEKE